MEAEQDIDDDTHICLKCRTTITGLDNYIAHRKTGCSRNTSVTSTVTSTITSASIPKSGNTSPTHEDTDPNLKADDFFSSLELQSSAKKTGASSGTSAKGILTRSKATAAILANSSSREVHHKPESELLGSYSTENFDAPESRDHLMMKVDERSDQEESGCEEDSNEEYEEEYEDEEDDRCPPRSHTGGKWKPGGLMSRGSPPSWMRTSASSTQPEDYRGSSSGGWSLLLDECHGSSAVTTEPTAPPPHYTGGKWKPTLPSQAVVNPQQALRGSQSDEEEDENLPGEQDTNSRRTSTSSVSRGPPPGHTSGKWIPGKHMRVDVGAGTGSESGAPGADNMMLMPPLRKSGSTIQYWCGPCNRRLSSRTLYERHLSSELHFKRTLQERELEEDPGPRDPMERNTGKRAVKRTEAYLNSEIWAKSKKRRLVSEMATGSVKQHKKHTKRREEVRCEVCRSKVWRHLLGKHLVSHYHCRKARSGHPDASSLILDNIHSIVKQAPFQCSPCKFYCHSMSNFRQHWTSQEHQETDQKLSGRYWCSFCKYESETSADMECHLESNEHRELVSVINLSVPIVIRKQSVLKCGTCGQEFRYNVQLRQHAAQTGHQDIQTASDTYQERFPCSQCAFLGNSCASLQRHIIHAHKNEECMKRTFFCTPCSLNFDTAEEAAQHRRSIGHKYTSLERRKERGLTDSEVAKVCQHCGGTFKNVLEFKVHIRERHAEFLYSCPHCGVKFALPQEVSRHVRECTYKIPLEMVSGTEPSPLPDNETEQDERDNEKCSQCPYKSNSRSELLFHEVLHGEPISDAGEMNEQPQVLRYRCPLCTREFRKSSLRAHLRSHTQERPFPCQICLREFGNRSSLVQHIKLTHRTSSSLACELCPFTTGHRGSMDRHRMTHTQRDKPFLCASCGASFFLKTTLQQHMKVHTGKDIKCQIEGCIFACRNQAELRNHLQVHSDERPYQCESCTYSAKTRPQLIRHQTIHAVEKTHRCPHCPFAGRMASHLRRHLRLHTGAKPYRCPYCPYTCNILENLRKHVLQTSKHPGKHLYECRFCLPTDTFKSNLAKDFKVHLYNVHPDNFSSLTLATSYVAGLYDANEDPKFIEDPIQPKPKINRRKKFSGVYDHIGLAKPPEEEEQDLSHERLRTVHPAQKLEKKRKPLILPLSSSTQITSSGQFQHGSREQLSTMVVVTEPADDVIYIQVPPDSEDGGLEHYSESVLFSSEGDTYLTNDQISSRRPSGGDRSSSNSIGCEATIMLPLGVEEVEEVQEVEAIDENAQMVVIKSDTSENRRSQRIAEEETTVITVPSSNASGNDFVRLPIIASGHNLSSTHPSEPLGQRVTTEHYQEVVSQTTEVIPSEEVSEETNSAHHQPHYLVIFK